MRKIILPITLVFMFLNFGCEETKGTGNNKERVDKEVKSEGEFWKEIEWDVKKITLMSLKNGISINKTKSVLNLYYRNYEKWILPEDSEDTDKYEKWVNQEINNISSSTSLTIEEVAKIIWEWEQEVYY